MLTHFRNWLRSGVRTGQFVPDRRKWSGLVAALCLAAPFSVNAQSGPGYPSSGYHQTTMSQAAPAYQIPSQRGPQQTNIQQVQNTPQSARAIHHLIEDMPQSQDELEIIQQRSQLVITRENVSKVAIGDQNVIDVVQYSPKQFAIVGLGLGSTNLMLWFENNPDPLIYTVKTIRDPNFDYQRKLDYGKLERKLAIAFPNSKVYLVPFSRKIIVRGQARDANEAAHILQLIRGEVISQEGSLFGPQGGIVGGGGGLNPNGPVGGIVGGYSGVGGYGFGGGALNAFDLAASFIINELQVPGEFQIALRIRIAEISRTAADNAGVNLNILFNDARNSVATAVGAATGNTFAGTFEQGEIGVFLDWLCSNGTAKILAEPNATVLSGRNVRFLAGGEFAVPTIVGVGGAQGTTTSFRGFGTSVLATPTIIDRDNIRIGVIAEYSNITNQNTVAGIPGMSTRRIETVVEMREGQTMAMGGLLSNRVTTQVQRIPLLGDIPYVGPLFFSAKSSTSEENELLILITPELVRPIDANEVPPVPGWDVTKPNHEEFWKYNMTEGQPDTGYYHSPPYGSGTPGTDVDYQHFNPGPAGSMYSPVPTNPGGAPTQQVPATPPPVNSTQVRQPSQYSQAATQRNGGSRTARPNGAAQTIPTGNQEIRQTNFSSQTGTQKDRRNIRRYSNNRE